MSEPALEGMPAALSSPKQSAVFTVLDGATLTFTSPAPFVPAFITSFAVAEGGPIEQLMFRAGPRAFGSLKAEGGGATLTEEYLLRPQLGPGTLPSVPEPSVGTLSLGEALQEDRQMSGLAREIMTFGVWQGARASVISEIKSPCCDELLTLFALFAFHEQEHGVSMRPLDPEVVTFTSDPVHAPSAVVPIPSYGLLEIYERTPEQERLLPAWSGYAVGGGELYQDGVQAPETPADDSETVATLVLVTPSAVAHIQPEREPSEASIIGWASELTISWDAQGP